MDRPTSREQGARFGPLDCECGGAHLRTLFEYQTPPPVETRFQFSARDYHREVLRCGLCGHCVARHQIDQAGMYGGEYVDSTYPEGLRLPFERVIALEPSESDNHGRVSAVLRFARSHFADGAAIRTVLDVGSGLCVFLHAMRTAGWDCTALDPDARAVEHARSVVGVRAVHGDFMVVADLGRFDLVTLNKVLEHVDDPIAMLARAARHLREEGFAYFEVPDADEASPLGKERQEFVIDHRHVFSAASAVLLAQRSGLIVRKLERLHEPSGKYTIRVFAVRGPS